MDLEKEFEDALERTKFLNQRPSNQVLLKLYALYKQASSGDISQATIDSALDVKSKAKYHAWKAERGKSKEACMREYILLVESLE